MTIRSMHSAARAVRRYLFSATCRFNERAALVVLIGIALLLRGPAILFAEPPGTAAALTLPDAPQASSSLPPQDEVDKKKQERNAAEGELHVEEHQHLMGFIPQFNTVFGDAVPPLSPSQKFELAFKRSITPLTIIGAGLIAGIGQANNSFPKYGQGAQGYGKRFGSQYADTFDSNMIGSYLPSYPAPGSSILSHGDRRLPQEVLVFPEYSGTHQGRRWEVAAWILHNSRKPCGRRYLESLFSAPRPRRPRSPRWTPARARELSEPSSRCPRGRTAVQSWSSPVPTSARSAGARLGHNDKRRIDRPDL